MRKLSLGVLAVGVLVSVATSEAPPIRLERWGDRVEMTEAPGRNTIRSIWILCSR